MFMLFRAGTVCLCLEGGVSLTWPWLAAIVSRTRFASVDYFQRSHMGKKVQTVFLHILPPAIPSPLSSAGISVLPRPP